ncbi:hypothetical protein QO002_005855 [Pararhizobium capsulatum DSM 1112]|uniref:Transposase n=1 Tax=Pararhizobium capsulatum DSM 1112 TaxID=1121113 RepID=A0ABU0C0F2_9HYPH|nr:hypothetical protein [Pararhizobium capsulatum DSM 1112]
MAAEHRMVAWRKPISTPAYNVRHLPSGESFEFLWSVNQSDLLARLFGLRKVNTT